ncbi:hypothetical protein HWV62_2832 [Athelia sp. TMB]|nr:hypothetical protein HWV62_2832 [Athelia sp. TMB]
MATTPTSPIRWAVTLLAYVTPGIVYKIGGLTDTDTYFTLLVIIPTTIFASIISSHWGNRNEQYHTFVFFLIRCMVWIFTIPQFGAIVAIILEAPFTHLMQAANTNMGLYITFWHGIWDFLSMAVRIVVGFMKLLSAEFLELGEIIQRLVPERVRAPEASDAPAPAIISDTDAKDAANGSNTDSASPNPPPYQTIANYTMRPPKDDLWIGYVNASVSYKKLPGTLLLTNTTLQWTQEGHPTPTVSVSNADAASLFCSREGAAQVRLKLGLVHDDAGHNFTFTSPKAHDERETFKKELTNIIARNRAPPPITPASSTSVAPTPAPIAAGIPGPVAAVRAASISRPPSSPRASSLPPPPVIPGADPASDFRLRKKVLLATPALAALHRSLVLSGQLTEAEFWAQRTHLLTAQTAADAQVRGRPGQLVDPRPETVDGEVRIVITPQLVHDIFEEYPVVQRAYSDVVPGKLTEAEFWKRYFGSKLFNAHRASIRSTAAQHVTKADTIFDKYLEKDDDELAPRRPPPASSSLLIDLGATLEDHDATSTTPDTTMQAGRQRGALPLIRRFNEHSERLLRTAAGDEDQNARALKRQRTDAGIDEAIDLDDLRAPTEGLGIALEMQDRQRYFEGQGTASTFEAANVDLKAAVREAAAGIPGWAQRLAALRVDKTAGDAALAAMSANVGARLSVRAQTNDFPPALFSQMTTCQTAANEFLRQFWAAIYPSSAATPAQRDKAAATATAAKMAGYLGKTPEKVAALVRAAPAEGVAAERVEVAMQPVLDAVERALGFYATRRK